MKTDLEDLGWKGYILNKTNEFYPYHHADSYKRYFGIEGRIALGTWLITGATHFTELLVVSGIMATDIVIRAMNGNHGEKAVSGLVGLTREIYDKLSDEK